MHFLVFNLAVAGALVYLVGGGKLPAGDLFKRGDGPAPAEAVVNHIDQTNEMIRKAVAEAMAKMQAERPEVAEEVAPSPVRQVPHKDPIKKQKQENKPKLAAKKTDKTQSLPPLAEAGEVKPQPRHVIDPTKAKPLARDKDMPRKTPTKVARLSSDVAERRAEVLEQKPASPDSLPKIKVEDGAELMSPSERLKELRAMTDDLEFMYLERRGG